MTVLSRDVTHEHADLAVINLAPVAAPLALDSHRMRAAFGETAWIEGDDAIGLAQPLGHLPHQHHDQRSVVPWGDTDEVLQDLSLDIDPGRSTVQNFAFSPRKPIGIPVPQGSVAHRLTKGLSKTHDYDEITTDTWFDNGIKNFALLAEEAMFIREWDQCLSLIWFDESLGVLRAKAWLQH
jgi:hypothetical protein